MNIWPLQKDCLNYYGNPAQKGWLHDNTVYVDCPWVLHVGKQPTSHILIHKHCAESLGHVLEAIWEACDRDASKIAALRYDRYDGSYNFRPMRGSSNMSMHSFACAIDWDAADNAFHDKHHLFNEQSLLVVKFKEEGWIWGGEWSPPDAMHVQAARIR
jgi:hypothetical protein